MSLNPAKLYNLNKGYIEEGADADLVIFSEGEQWTVDEHFASKACNSPFIGEETVWQGKYTVAAENRV